MSRAKVSSTKQTKQDKEEVMMTMVYEWRKDSHFSSNAQAVGEHLAELANGEERITPDVVVTDAKRKSSPLHPYFEWDDSEAATQYRLHQARQLIGAVMVVRDELKGESTRAFVNIRVSSDDQSYRGIESVLSDADLRAQLLRQALSELDSLKRRYAHLSELAKVFAAADRVSRKARSA